MQCRCLIRRHLVLQAGSRDLFASINRLPVPFAMKNLLNIIDFAACYPDFIPSFTSRPLSHVCAV
jgi:hypothetical protein